MAVVRFSDAMELAEIQYLAKCMVKSKMAAIGLVFLSNVNTFSTTFAMRSNSQIANL